MDNENIKDVNQEEDNIIKVTPKDNIVNQENNSSIEVGMTLGHFTIEKQLGVGGMGEVWLARQGTMERKVALKILSPKLVRETTYIDKFMSEIKVSAKLEHPNIVSAYDAGKENGIYYLAISYIEGDELTNIIEKYGALDEKKSLNIILKMSQALEYAWRKFSMIHRDIKPANIMIDNDNDEPRLMDMGISKFAGSIEKTQVGMITGSPYYISPEQAKADKDLDFRSDMYSLGCTLYHCLTGEVPYPGNTAMQIISKHLNEPIPDPVKLKSDVSMECKALLKKMMSKDKSKRHKSWGLLVDDVQKVLNGEFPVSENILKQTSVSIRLKCECGFSMIVARPNKVKEVKCRKCGKNLIKNQDESIEIDDFEKPTAHSITQELIETPANSANESKKPKSQEDLINELNTFKKKKSFLQIKGKKVCFSCGKNVEENATTCDKCFADLENQIPPEQANSKNTDDTTTAKTKKPFPVMNCLLVVILLGFCIIILSAGIAGFMYYDEILKFLDL